MKSLNENIFMGSQLEEDESLLNEVYNYKSTSNVKSNDGDSEIFGVDYGKDYYKFLEEDPSNSYEEVNKETHEDVYSLIKYEEDIYTNLVEIDNDKGIIKSIKRVSCVPIIDNTKVININLPDDTKEKKCIIQGNFVFKLEHYINDNTKVIYESKYILPFSKIIVIPIEITNRVKVYVKMEDYYLKAISSYSLILSASVLFVLYERENL